METPVWHCMSVEEALKTLGSSPQGITPEEAEKRLALHGPNELIEKKKQTPLMMFLGQFTDFMIIVLIAAAAVSGVIGEPSDAVAIMVIVLLNAALGFSQEYRAEKAMAALKKIAAATATVLRAGAPQAVPAAHLVPGDIVQLEAGNVVPADMRIIEAARLTAEEAALTGESHPVEKHAGMLDEESLPLADRKNMLYKGTVVAYGRGAGAVTATGMDTELGRIAAMLQEQGEAKTPLQKRLADFGRKLSIAVLAICAIIFAAGLLRGERPVEVFLVAVSLAVAAIPEALPAVVTISLAFGARKMVRLNALVRKLPAVETLGSVTYICTDKTGTLTENRMIVVEMWVDGTAVRSSASGVRSEKHLLAAPNSPLQTFLTALALSNDSRFDSAGKIIGDPTEAALLSVALERGFDKRALESVYPRVAEIPFDSERKLMTTFHKIPPSPPFKTPLTPAPLPNGKREKERGGIFGPAGAVKYVSFTKGALEALIERSQYALTSEGRKPLAKDAVLRANDAMAAGGLRVIGVAMRTWDELPRDLFPAHVEAGLTLLGLAGMADPSRPEAAESVALCRTAGITPVMITGDHPVTAKVIGRQVGILEVDVPGAVVTGAELAAFPMEEFEARVEDVRVYARVAPEQKLKIVKALQDKGHFVAMTGDGVNDAPALKRADIGVAMGITGTDVAKQASSMILLDDDFATIVKAVKEGRRIYDNVRKFIKYLLTTNSGEIWTLFLAPFFGLPIPLVPIQILWINLLTDGLPALALSLEPEESDVMKRPPRRPTESIFAHGLGLHAIWVGLLMAAVTIPLQAWAIHVGDAHWQTMVFTVLCFLQLGHVLAIRSEKESLFRQGLLSNTPLLISVLAMTGLQLLTVYVPFLNAVFKTEPLSAGELLAVLGLSSIVFIAVEAEKLVKRAKKIA